MATAGSFVRLQLDGVKQEPLTPQETIDALAATVPEWTGFHNFQAGALFDTDMAVATFIGSGGAANIGLNASYVAGEAAEPEIGAQFTIASDIGDANPTTAYKIALTASVVADTDSADIYSINTITHGYGGTGGYLITGIESDINNIGVDAETLGASTAVYAFVAVSAGSAKSTAGLWVTKSTDEFTHGVAVDSATLFGFYDYSGSTTCFRGDGTHQTGLDLSEGTFDQAIALANNDAIIAKDSGAVFRNLIKITAGDVVEVGAAAVSLTLLGTITNFGAWTAYTPTVTAAGGTFTSASATGRHRTLGKTTFFQQEIAIVTNGTANSAVIATLPSTASQRGVANTYERSLTGLQGRGTIVSGSGDCVISYADGSYPGADGANIIVSGFYETA